MFYKEFMVKVLMSYEGRVGKLNSVFIIIILFIVYKLFSNYLKGILDFWCI